jgi:PAS domain S-box-containing protein
MLRIVAHSIRHKLTLLVLATTLAALVVTGVALVIYDLRGYQEAGINDLVTQAEILGRASAPALAFEDTKAANENLQLLKAKPGISSAAIYNAKGKLFASYTRRDSDLDLPRLPESEGSRIEGQDFVMFKRIVENNEILGTVYLRAEHGLLERLADYLGIFGAVTAISLLVAWLISGWLQAVVTRPILDTAAVARQVMERRDFSLRAVKTTEDEIGQLVDAFNGMLAEVGRRAEALETLNQSLAREMADRQHADDEVRKLNVELERRVAERTAQLQAVADTANDGIISADERGRIVYFNRGAERMFGHPAEKIIGRPITILMPARFHDAHSAGFQRFLATGEARVVGKTVELTGMNKDGKEFPVELSLANWTTAQGMFFTAILRDITARKQAEETLKTVNEQMTAANKELEGFSYSVSHDLRSPLRAVIGFSKLLLEDHAGQLDEEARRKLGIMQGEAQRMGVLIDDLLAFSRLGRKAMQVADIDMTELARTTFAGLNGQGGGPKAEFRLGALPRGKGDRVLLGQVWANLLANALKFSAKRDKPLVEVSAISDEKEYVYFVRDNGAGFDPRYQSKLFGVFQRLHNSSEFPGTGVGLALVQRIVVRHGGRVWADGKLNEGATFYFTLPKEQADGTV